MSDFLSNRIIDKIEGFKFSTPNGFSLFENGQVYFLDLSNNSDYSDYIDGNLEQIRNDLTQKNRNFIHGKPVFPAEIFLYRYPFLPKDKIEKVLNSNYSINDSDLLNTLGYRGFVQTGFLSIVNGFAVFIEKKENESIEEFVSGYISQLQPYINYLTNISFSAEPFDVEEDDETKNLVRQIKSVLQQLKQTKSDFYVMSLLDTMYNEIKSENPLFQNGKFSTLLIEEDFRILLPEYDLEIKLPHLTKSIYFLFLKQEEGIKLHEFHKYKTELLEIYKKVSYQTSYDKMVKSVEDLCVNPEKLYPHFSRIKSAFVSQFTDNYAYVYYVNGTKKAPKRVFINREYIMWKAEI